MFRTVLKSKIHRARVTEANLNYEGSITIARLLMDKADIIPHEKVEVLNLNNGQRLETYAIPGEKGSGVICLNGPAARSAVVGDVVIIVTYVSLEDSAARLAEPVIVNVDEKNRLKD
jgi:aspartate 1-decarboxylase